MDELQRTRIDPPLGLKPYPEHRCPRPVLGDGTRVQVLPFHDELGRVIERWDFSEVDIRYYHVEKFVRKRVMVEYDAKGPV